MRKKRKKLLGILCSISFSFIGIMGIPQLEKAAKAAEIAINESNFPDDTFRDDVLRQIDRDNNQMLSDKEIQDTVHIDIDMPEGTEKITSLKGIEYFTQIRSLSCRNEALESLDLSKNTKLRILYCDSNNLTNLNISKNTELDAVYCDSNNLTSLDVSKNTKLELLDCANNQLTELDLHNNTKLTELYCNSNKLEALDLSKNTSLLRLCCYNNVLDNIKLDIQSYSVLQLKARDLYNSKKDITFTNITKDKYGMLTVTDPAHPAKYQDMESMDHPTEITYINSIGNTPTPPTPPIVPIDEEHFPDASFREFIKKYVVNDSKYFGDGNEILSNDELELTTEINTWWEDEGENGTRKISSKISSLQGMEYFKSLYSIVCIDTQIKDLDLSHYPELEELWCGNTQIKRLDLSNNPVLEFLSCAGNKLEELKLNTRSYGTLELWDDSLHGEGTTLSNLSNITRGEDGLLTVLDPAKPATYQYSNPNINNGAVMKCTIIYTDGSDSPVTPTPSKNFVPATGSHLFYDYDNTKSVSGSAIVIYGNGAKQKVDGKDINNKEFVAYTDILASYNYTVNSKGTVKASVGKVIAGITSSDAKPSLNNKKKIVDTAAAKIAKAKIKNGIVKVAATGKEKGLVYLWIMDTGKKEVSECYPVNVELAPKKLEVQNSTGSKLKNTKLENGKTLDVKVAGIVSNSLKTTDCTYTATVAANSQSYITVSPVTGSAEQFTIAATGLKNNKKTKASITFQCDQNGKKIKFSLTVIPKETET